MHSSHLSLLEALCYWASGRPWTFPLLHRSSDVPLPTGHFCAGAGVSRLATPAWALVVFDGLVLIIEVVLNGLADGEAACGVAMLRRVGANHDEAIRLAEIARERSKELFSRVFGDFAVHVEVHRVGAVFEAVLLDTDGLAVDDVADACVAPQLETASVNVGVEDTVEQLVGRVRVSLVDDVPLVFTHVVAKAQQPVGVSCVVLDTGGVLTGNTAWTDEQCCVCDEQCALSLVDRVGVEGKFSSEHDAPSVVTFRSAGFMIGNQNKILLVLIPNHNQEYITEYLLMYLESSVYLNEVKL